MVSKNIKFQIRGIELLDSTIKHPEKELPKETRYNFDINIKHNIIGEEKLIIVSPSITIVFDDDKQIHASIRVNFLYMVDNLDEMKLEDSDKYDIPDSFITTLNSISLSTIRGIMYSQFKGTFLHNTILPVVNPADFKRE